MTNINLDLYNRIQPQIEELYKELSILSKNKPDNPINQFKLSLINEQLQEANALLGEDNKPSKAFSTFDAANLPTNSDVVVILSQYLSCLKRWLEINYPSPDFLL